MAGSASQRPAADRVSGRGIERPAGIRPDPIQTCAALGGLNALILNGRAELGAESRSELGWGPLVAIAPQVVIEQRSTTPAGAAQALADFDRVLDRRRSEGGPSGCGVAVLVSYEFFNCGVRTQAHNPLPSFVAWTIDAAVRFEGAVPVAVARAGAEPLLHGLEDRVGDWREPPPGTDDSALRASTAALRTSLPKARYLDAVACVKEHIRRGDIYQANLTQRFELAWRENPVALFRRLTASVPAPRAAFVAGCGFAVASASPETFLSVTPAGRISTWPIKGTRRRGETPEADLTAARELMESEKDHAELTMIVDLERNDLGRVCRAGSIRVSAPPQLRSYSAVHHLVAEVEGELVPGTSASELIRATFPGGSITGAPKIRAMEILRTLEPVARDYYTGSLFWFGDDGSMDSSILIRSVILANGVARVGAGGGVVADSEPEGEWRESNDKARAILGVFGAVPEEAL